jgi:FAD:protein FMN transferase
LEEQNNSNILGSLPDRIRNIISNSVAAILVLLLLLLIYAGYRSIAARYAGVTGSLNIMGTVFQIRVNGENTSGHVKATLDKVREITGQINYSDEKSEVSSINGMAGISAVSVSHDTFDLIDKTLRLSRQTGGAFDVTIGPLVDIWNFGAKTHTDIPTGNELIYAQHLVNFSNVQMNDHNETVKLLYPGMKIDLSGVVKGYAISIARAMLVARGVKSAIINAGSSITVIGDNRGKPWKIGIKDPRHPDAFVGVVTLTAGQALSTSADYDRYFEVGGKRFHDILDPATGMPADQCRSVSIISDDATQSDMLSAAVFIMGPKRGLAFVSSLQNVYAIIIDKDGNLITSPGLILEK